ncbi:Las1-like-domain-containing protein [Flagelloscypha sp. PMI_526]|nr:Las1-like-domain-containing protein [Flagelloscypha sp. PMI_526]
MRLPKRVPWSSLSEFEQVCSWIYQDENDLESKSLALNRLAAWKATCALPHALESTISLLSVILQDKLSPTSYSSAVIRLVNGFVDPLQSGVYARSIASIASQIGLPAWLVEVRHAATHEDLPSLELLREAARQSMAWLLQNYFLPTLTPTTNMSTIEAPPLRPVSPILAQYKTLLKITTRDASVHTQYKHEINAVLRELERWLSEAKVSANPLSGLNSQQDPSQLGEEEFKEYWSLEQLCEALMEPGAIVPLAKAKRIFPSDTFLPTESAVAIWTPLLQHVQSFHPDFLTVLSGSITSSLYLQHRGVDEGGARWDASFINSLSRWVYWAVSCAEDAPKEGNEASNQLRKDTIIALVTGIGPSLHQPNRDLAEALCEGDENLLGLLSLSLEPSQETWSEEAMLTMENRLQSLATNLSTNFERPNRGRSADRQV